MCICVCAYVCVCVCPFLPMAACLYIDNGISCIFLNLKTVQFPLLQSTQPACSRALCLSRTKNVPFCEKYAVEGALLCNRYMYTGFVCNLSYTHTTLFSRSTRSFSILPFSMNITHDSLHSNE